MKPVLLIILLFPSLMFSQTASDCGCEELWSKEAATSFVQILENATREPLNVWGDYYPGQGEIVLNAGLTKDSLHCIGIWKDGKNIAYGCVKDHPRMLTPLFTYYLDYESADPNLRGLTGTRDESPGFNRFMKENGVVSAVYMPVEFPELPFEIPALKKVQLAIHESFHVEVQFPQWMLGEGYWPHWDQQPDRPGVQDCYTHPVAAAMIRNEMETLAGLLEALLNNEASTACRKGKQYLDMRNQRYDSLRSVTVKLYDQSPGDCRTVESIMEIEEGLADYASWTYLYNASIISKEEILDRYRAKQQDHYYLSGNMLMHAIELMDPSSIHQIIDELVSSPDLQKGNLLYLFEREFGKYCARVN